ncbi:MAG TPA: peptide chain release factor N(5)-glutamine methyltransferase [Porticoccaceae bacterium]|nr:peptide chain release factor N(5)-glutamine methyltransferase [Porticoccaceae bacterium]
MVLDGLELLAVELRPLVVGVRGVELELEPRRGPLLLAGGEPIAYLTGLQDFWSLSLEVNTSTLIPRPETELLVETSLELIDLQDARVLDLGTGTGAVALALAKERPGWEVLAVDVVLEAVALAERNRCRHGLDNVSVMESNWFAGLAGRRFDLIVSNPPYIEPDDPHLLQGDVRFEPRSALVAKNRGFSALETIASGASAYLKAGGWLLLEHGFDQAKTVRALLRASGFVEVASRRDNQGHERVSHGRKPG